MHVFAGTNSLLILGTTAEAPTLTENEKDSIVSYVINKVNKRLKIVVGVITNNTNEGIILAKKYERMGVDFLLISPPYYNKTNFNGLIKHFECIANSVNIPILIYNVPSRIGLNITIEQYIKLKSLKNIVGVKECSKDIDQIIELAQMCDEKFNLYCGNDELSYLFLSLGAKGWINVSGNFCPVAIKNLFDIFENNEHLAMNYFFALHDFFKSLSVEVNPIPIKTLMNYIGMDVGCVRLPLGNMDERNEEKLINCYKNTFFL